MKTWIKLEQIKIFIQEYFKVMRSRFCATKL